jgi:hypothetical protein
MIEGVIEGGCSLTKNLNFLRFRARFTGEESALACQTTDSSRGTAALRNDNFRKFPNCIAAQ